MSAKWQPGTYAILPLAIAADRRLTAAQMRVLIALAAHAAGPEDVVWPSRAKIGQMTGYTPENVSKYTRQLESLGWLRRVGRGGGRSTTRWKIVVPAECTASVRAGVMNDKRGEEHADTLQRAKSIWKQIKDIYPLRAGANPEARAIKAIAERLQEGEREKALIEGVMRYRDYCIASGKIGTEYVQQAATFFGEDRGYAEEWEWSWDGYSWLSSPNNAIQEEYMETDLAQLTL